ncbi:MAG: InlB B-repeat-containing protein [Synergistaceae bacterium]|nr:InlB B-repeat-containing protein [Synergistaceae bacterium]
MKKNGIKGLAAVRRFLSAIVFVAVFSVCAVSPSWALDTWDGNSTIAWEGTGTIGDPYLISTGSQLAGIASQVNEGTYVYSTKYFKLMDNIDLNGGVYKWQPIGYNYGDLYVQSRPFKGNFDGNGFTISNMAVDLSDQEGVGLFGNIVNATVSDLHLTNVNVVGKDRVGGLVGNSITSRITNSTVSGSVKGNNYVGGLVGCLENSSIISFGMASGTVSGTKEVGGISGRATKSEISNSIAISAVVGTDYIGGIAGGVDNNFKVEYCAASGSVKGNSYVGGLVGAAYYWNSGGEISNSIAYGVVEGNSNVGGLAGDFSNTYIGILNSVASGRVIGNTKVGGLIGEGNDITESVFDTQGTSITSGSTATDRTTQVLSSGTSITGLSGLWAYKSGYYPRPTSLADSSIQDIFEASALSAVPLYLTAGDTTAAVTKPFTVPTVTASGTSITWSAIPSSALTVSSSGGVSLNNTGNVELTATAGRFSKLFKLVIQASGLPSDNYSVVFDSQGGSGVPAATVASGSKITEPPAPTRVGYTFSGWYKDASGTTAWNFANDLVTGNITLYAIWTPVSIGTTYAVTFNSQGGSSVSPITGVASGSKITAPLTPTRSGYSFAGWYKDASVTTAWNFTIDVVTSNITLYAKWTSIGGGGGSDGGGCNTGAAGAAALVLFCVARVLTGKKR